ncbi:MAG: hypothetical protein HDR98_09555 [Bacteroides sp.]|nr:hypothetical protein [Bacteroides sp.]
MWKLRAPSEQLLKWYEKKLLEGLSTRIKSNQDENDNILLDERIQRILIPHNPDGSDDTSILKLLLTLPPKELHELSDHLMKQIIVNYDEGELESFLEAKRKREDNRDEDEKIIYNKYNSTLSKLRKVFDYDGQISSNKSRAYKLTFDQGYNTCTYCNRQYVITVGGTNDVSRIARPELDHWYSKELFPLMSLSIYNLIPSCSICNSSVKGNSIFRLSTHIHPYVESNDDPDFTFRYKLDSGAESKWTVVLDTASPQAQNMIDAFKLDKLYSFHGELEVKDILLFNYQNSDTYLKFLLQDLLSHYHYSKQDIYRMIFGAELDLSANLNRPFSKLKRDVLIQLGIIEKDGDGFRFVE